MVMTEGWCKWHGFSHMKNMTLVSRGTIVIIFLLPIYGDLESGLYHLLIINHDFHDPCQGTLGKRWECW